MNEVKYNEDMFREYKQKYEEASDYIKVLQGADNTSFNSGSKLTENNKSELYLSESIDHSRSEFLNNYRKLF